MRQTYSLFFCHINPLAHYSFSTSRLDTLLSQLFVLFLAITHDTALSLPVLSDCPHLPLRWLTTSVTSTTGSGSSASRQSPACSLDTQTNHLVLYFVALMHGQYIFLYYWKCPLLLSYLSDVLK